jgi:hypothetical protein
MTVLTHSFSSPKLARIVRTTVRTCGDAVTPSRAFGGCAGVMFTSGRIPSKEDETK